jgi:predicted RNA binding protein YcfA (HicA-like mRNA interferase family)
MSTVKVRDSIRLLESSWKVIAVPGQPGKDVPVGTLQAILRSAGSEEKEED